MKQLMANTELSVEIDENVLDNAKTVLQALGIDLSTAISIYLTQVWISKGIPFPLNLGRTRASDLEGYSIEQCFRAAVRKTIA